ncbi:heme-binding protein [Agaribacter marinus]|uniref:heme-binding protein n=1 Tax=Agaribacter marinus TaxID=1431249 RepID=UPI0024E065B5|nr:heme-binding protein [Agaribacter marinus]
MQQTTHSRFRRRHAFKTGVLIGGLGVSGAPPEIDVKCAEAGLANLHAKQID